MILEKQLELLLKNYAENAMGKVISWKGNNLEQKFESMERLLNNEEKGNNPFYKALLIFKEVPHYIAGGEYMWIDLPKILNDEEFTKQLKVFYNVDYPNLLKEVDSDFFSSNPIWMTMSEPEIEKGIYPVVIEHKGKKCIVLLFNKKEA